MTYSGYTLRISSLYLPYIFNIPSIYLECSFLLPSFFLPSFYLLPTHYFVFTKGIFSVVIVRYGLSMSQELSIFNSQLPIVNCQLLIVNFLSLFNLQTKESESSLSITSRELWFVIYRSHIEYKLNIHSISASFLQILMQILGKWCRLLDRKQYICDR